MTRYQNFLLLAFILVWIWAAINPKHPHDWLLENILVFIFIPIIIVAGKYFRLSSLSYTLITLHMMLHVIGSHYTYAEVPFGYTLQEWFGAERNMYDRLVHFLFGVLYAYPFREVFVRITQSKGFWGFWFPIELVTAFGALYEIIEWIAAANVSPEAGMAFLGTQGDIWDAQKDMLLASIGGILTMVIVFFFHLKYNKHIWKEVTASFHIPKGDKPLGEVKLQEWIKKAKKNSM